VQRFGRKALLCLAVLAALVWAACVALKPVLLNHDEVADIRRLSAEVTLAEQGNEALRRRIRTLQTPKGIEVEARRLSWVQPGEILIQTSETPPPPPAKDPEAARKTPPLGAVRRESGFFRRAYDLASRALRGGRQREP